MDKAKPIVIIDDEQYRLDYLQELLETGKYNALSASDLTEAKNLILDHDPALVICDFKMPECDGVEFCKRIRSEGHLSKGFFIIYSAYDKPDLDGDDFHPHFPDGYISKKMKARELLAEIDCWYTMSLKYGSGKNGTEKK